MATNLVDSVTSYLTPDVMQKISSLVGENPSTTQRAMEGIVPALLSKMADMSSSSDGANQLSNMINQSPNGRLLGNLSGELSGGSATQKIMNSGRDILSGLFGGGLNTGVESIARFLGLRNSSVTSLLSIAAPLILGVLGKERSSQGLSVGGLANLLTGQKSLLAGLVPAGLAGFLGARSPGKEATSVDAATRPYIREPRVGAEEVREKTPAWLWPTLGLAAVGLLLYFFVARPTIPTPDIKSAQLSLPDGKSLALKAGSLTHSLAGFLGSGADTASAKPLVFDNLNFEFGSAKLTADSEETVNELVAILKAYPSVQVKLDGFTDNVGDAEENRKLSQARADAIKDRLVQSGIDSGRIMTAGYGPDRPIASNDSDEGRAKNRRLELTVVKK